MFPRREGFQEGHTHFVYGSEQAGFTDVTSRDGISNDDMDKCVSATMNFINDKLSMCSYPIETKSVEKMEKDSVVVFRCKFMFLVTSTNFPFMLGVESNVSDGKVIRAATQDMIKSQAPPDGLAENFMSFSEIESQKVYSR